MTTKIKVAFATSDGQHVNQHFGAAGMFAIYLVDAGGSRPVETIRFREQKMDGDEDKLAAKITALDGCAAVHVQAIGPSAINRLGVEGIQAITVAPGAKIASLLDSLIRALDRGPEGWLAGAIARGERRADKGRFDKMAEEGWEEGEEE
uniref:Nitrogen fixation protein NifX n=1 Tax=Candidatus Kentrum sp. FW TaxID=2126338 RepID=A0A450THU3_9GAMM|nr:MAG: nitrogen fixation protein NifX [Candidatus Kentron sp. FW]